MPEVLTVKEMAALLKVHRSTVYRMVRKGELPAFKVGSGLRFVRFEVHWCRVPIK